MHAITEGKIMFGYTRAHKNNTQQQQQANKPNENELRKKNRVQWYLQKTRAHTHSLARLANSHAASQPPQAQVQCGKLA